MDVVALVISVLALIASCAAAWYARSQADTARKQLAADTEANLRITITDIGSLPDYSYDRDGTSTQPVWFLENHGRAVALDVVIRLEFDPNGLQYGVRMVDQVAANDKVRIKSKQPLPAFHELIVSASPRRMQTASLAWRSASGEDRAITIPIGL